jgi:hypothetical protein
MVCVRHIGSNYTARDFSLRVAPRDAPRTGVGAGVDEALAGEVIEIEPQAILQAGSISRTRHRCLPTFISEFAQLAGQVDQLGIGFSVRFAPLYFTAGLTPLPFAGVAQLGQGHCLSALSEPPSRF